MRVTGAVTDEPEDVGVGSRDGMYIRAVASDQDRHAGRWSERVLADPVVLALERHRLAGEQGRIPDRSYSRRA
jgi:hypothetical protein